MRLRRAGPLLVAAGALSVFVRRRRLGAVRQTVTAHRAILIAGMARFFWPWDGIIDGIVSIGADVKAAILTVVNAAIQTVFDAWGWLSDRVHDIVVRFFGFVTDITNRVYELAQLIDSVGDNLYNRATHALDSIAGLVTTVFNSLWNEALHDLWDPITRIIGDALNLALQGLSDFLHDPIGFITGLVNGLISAALAELEARLGDLLNIGDLVRQLVDQELRLLLGPGYDAFMTFIQHLPDIIGFLVFVAEHPFTWWETYAQDLFDMGPDGIIGAVTAAVDGMAGPASARLEEWLGT